MIRSPFSTSMPAVDSRSLLAVLIPAITEVFAGAIAAVTDGDRAAALRVELTLLSDTIETVQKRREAVAATLRSYERDRLQGACLAGGGARRPHADHRAHPVAIRIAACNHRGSQQTAREIHARMERRRPRF